MSLFILVLICAIYLTLSVNTLSDRIRSGLDMTQGAIWPLLISFTTPLLLGNAFQLLYNTVDSVVVGNFVGTSALAAVGAATQICNTAVKFFNGISVGAGAVISRYCGAKDEQNETKAICTTMVLTICACVALTIGGITSADWMLQKMATPEDVFGEASRYLKIYFAGISGLLIYNMGSAVLRAVGDSKRPLIFLVACSGINIVLDLVFVVGLGWGISGAAIATVLAQLISAVLVLRELKRMGMGKMLLSRNLRVKGKSAALILKNGLPVGLQMAIIALSNVFLQGYINVFGSDCMAGWSCFLKLDQYLMLPVQSIGQATTTFVGQNIGAKKWRRARKGTWVAFGIGLGVSAVAAVILAVFARGLVGLFSPEEGVKAHGAMFVRLCAPLAMFCCFNQVLSGALRGMEKPHAPMVITLSTHVFVRQIYLFIMVCLIPENIYVVVFSYPLGWILCAFVTTVYYLLASRKYPDRSAEDRA